MSTWTSAFKTISDFTAPHGILRILWTALDFSGINRTLTDFIELQKILQDWTLRTALDFTGINQALPDFIGLFWTSSNFNRLQLTFLGFANFITFSGRHHRTLSRNL